MSDIHVEQCPICKHRGFNPFLTCTDFYATQKQFKLEKCAKCGFVVTQDFPSQDEIGVYYEVENYISHSDTKEGLMNKLYHWVRSYSLKNKADLVTKLSGQEHGGSLLDFGSGTGYFLNEMKKRHWMVTGVEKSQSARESAKSKFNLDVQVEDFLYQIPNKQKDVVTMWHVLEHVETFDTLIVKMQHILKDNGSLIIAIPNINSFDAHYYKQFWAAYDVPRHLWHFSPNNIHQLAGQHGLEVVKIKPMHFDVFYISMLSEKYKQTIFPTLIGGLKGFWFFCRNIFSKNKASSLIYILKKQSC